MTTVPLEICLQGFKRSFGFQYILVSMRWKRAKCRQAGRQVELFWTVPLEQVAREGLSWVEYVRGQVGAF